MFESIRIEADFLCLTAFLFEQMLPSDSPAEWRLIPHSFLPSLTAEQRRQYRIRRMSAPPISLDQLKREHQECQVRMTEQIEEQEHILELLSWQDTVGELERWLAIDDLRKELEDLYSSQGRTIAGQRAEIRNLQLRIARLSSTSVPSVAGSSAPTSVSSIASTAAASSPAVAPKKKRKFEEESKEEDEEEVQPTKKIKPTIEAEADKLYVVGAIVKELSDWPLIVGRLKRISTRYSILRIQSQKTRQHHHPIRPQLRAPPAS